MMYKGKAQKGMEDVEDDGDNQGQLSGSGTGSNTYRQK